MVGGPYDAKVGAIAKSFLEANGIAVLATHEPGLTDNLAVGRLLRDLTGSGAPRVA